MDAPPVLNCVGTPIAGNTGAFLTVVAVLPSDIRRLIITETIGAHIGIYRGAPGSEIEVGSISGSGKYALDITLFKGDRISLRSLEPGIITRGTLLIEFYAER